MITVLIVNVTSSPNHGGGPREVGDVRDTREWTEGSARKHNNYIAAVGREHDWREGSEVLEGDVDGEHKDCPV